MGWYQTLGFFNMKYFFAPKDELINMYEVQFMSAQEIADYYGVSYTIIYNNLRKYIKLRRGGGKTKSVLNGYKKMIGRPSPNKGKKLSQKQKDFLSEIAKQRVGNKSPRWGVKLSEETKNKISNSLKGRFRGPDNPNWKEEKTTKRRFERRFEYKNWRKSVFERDKYNCAMCKLPSAGDIQAHHIITIEKKSRFNVNNRQRRNFTQKMSPKNTPSRTRMAKLL